MESAKLLPADRVPCRTQNKIALAQRPAAAALLSGLVIGMWVSSSVARADTFVFDFESQELSQANQFGSFHDGRLRPDGFHEGLVRLTNDFQDFGEFTAWSGWAVSDSSDASTPGFENQYSSVAGGGADRQSRENAQAIPGQQFGVAFVTDADPAAIHFDVPLRVEGLHITNTTYAALSMQLGDQFAKKFGGLSGEDPDFLEVTVSGWDQAGSELGQVTASLAEFRGDEDSILRHWQWIDLTTLGEEVERLTFAMTSSDVGPFGINTPTYFAMDNLVITVVPEPRLGLLSIVAWIMMGLGRLRQRTVFAGRCT